MEDEKQKKEKGNKYPPGLYKRGQSWIVQFVFKGVRYSDNIGAVGLTVAKERVRSAKTHVAEGKLAVNGKRWNGHEWISAIEPAKVEDLLFEDACATYLEWYQANRAASSYEQYALPASKALKASFTGKRLSEISPFAVEAHKLSRKRGPDAVTDCTVDHDLMFLRAMYNKALKWNFADVSPMGAGKDGKAKVSLFKTDNSRNRHLSEEEAENLLAACNLDLRLCVLAAMQTGFRKKELSSIKWSSVDLTRGTATVESGYSKNGEARTIPLTPDLTAVLRTLKQERKPKPEDLVFIGKKKTWRKAFATALKKAGIQDFRWHDLRHCFGSWLAMNNVPDKARMELMGHKSAAMTARYTHLSDNYKQQAVANLPQFGAKVLEGELQQFSQQAEEKKVVAFAK